MKWSWKIMNVAGIGLYVHVTFFLLIGWIAFVDSWLGVLFILALFACVVLHELGHALTAKRYGIQTRDITLLPIGGVARLERMPDDPWQELWVALAGPAVNVVIAFILYLWLMLTSTYRPLQELALTGGSFAQHLMVVNVFLVVFNMLPAFPMDGGRVVRALLATRMDYARATQFAASLGKAMAFLFGFVGIFWLYNPFLLLIAVFVWIGASYEANLVQMKTTLDGVPVDRAMMTHFQSLSPNDTLAHVVDVILTGPQHDFPVLNDGHVLGILTRQNLMSALAKQTRNTPVSEVMKRDISPVRSSDMLETAFVRLQSSESPMLPVVRDGGELIGLITMENLAEYIMIQSALGTRQAAKQREITTHARATS